MWSFHTDDTNDTNDTNDDCLIEFSSFYWSRSAWLDPDFKKTLQQQLQQFAQQVLVPAVQTTLMQNVLDLIDAEISFSEVVQSLEDSFRKASHDLRAQWQVAQQHHERISSLAKRQSTWERDRQMCNDEQVRLDESKHLNLKYLHDERKKRLKKSVYSFDQILNQEQKEKEEEEEEEAEEAEEEVYLAAEEEVRSICCVMVYYEILTIFFGLAG